MENFKDKGSFRVRGIVGIYDVTDPNHVVELVKKNAVHEGNIVYNIARAFIGGDDGRSAIGWIAFGDGGSEIASTGRITYRPTNTSRSRNELADLYNRVYQKNVSDEGFNSYVSPVIHTRPIADINMDVMLYMGEPSGQLPMDNASQFGDSFVFDEIGLFTNEPDINDAMMLTHVIFHPIQKSLNRTLQIKYTLRFEIV